MSGQAEMGELPAGLQTERASERDTQPPRTAVQPHIRTHSPITQSSQHGIHQLHTQTQMLQYRRFKEESSKELNNRTKVCAAQHIKTLRLLCHLHLIVPF